MKTILTLFQLRENLHKLEQAHNLLSSLEFADNYDLPHDERASYLFEESLLEPLIKEINKTTSAVEKEERERFRTFLPLQKVCQADKL